MVAKRSKKRKEYLESLVSEVEERDDELPRVDAREQQVDADVHCQQVQVLSREVEVLTLHTTSDTTYNK